MAALEPKVRGRERDPGDEGPYSGPHRVACALRVACLDMQQGVRVEAILGAQNGALGNFLNWTPDWMFNPDTPCHGVRTLEMESMSCTAFFFTPESTVSNSKPFEGSNYQVSVLHFFHPTDPWLGESTQNLLDSHFLPRFCQPHISSWGLNSSIAWLEQAWPLERWQSVQCSKG